MNNCQKATEIDPLSADAWHLYSQTNEEAMMHYSRLFSLEQKKKAEKLSGNKDFLLHREFGHFRLPKLQEQPLAKSYTKHLLSGLTGLIK